MHPLPIVLLTLQWALSFSQQIPYDSCIDGAISPDHTCNGRADLPIFDGRLSPRKQPRQCRVLCLKFSHPAVRAFHVGANCTICRQSESMLFTTVLSDINGRYPHVCIPRGVCVARCGPERPGCVYTGSCGTQICFQERTTGKPAKVQRATFSGPGTLLQAEDERRTVVTIGNQAEYVLSRMIQKGIQVCNFVGYRLLTPNCTAEDVFLPKENGGLCRTLCSGFDQKDVEVVRRLSKCGFCSRNVAQQYFSENKDDADRPHLCIPRDVCVKECGEEGKGCVYAGSCKSMYCFSGMDSKKPANVTFVNGKWSIVVDNTAKPISLDPPAFAGFSANGTVSPVPSDTHASPTPKAASSSLPVPSHIITASPTPASGSKNDTSLQNAGDNVPGKDKAENRTWLWLGPVLGLVGSGIAAAAGVASAYILRRRRENHDDKEYHISTASIFDVDISP